MRGSLAILIGGLALAGSGWASPIILHLKNGDKVTGELVSESSRWVVLKSPVLGRVKIVPEDVSRREIPGADKPKTAAVAAGSPPAGGKPTPSPSSPSAPPAPLTTNSIVLSKKAPSWVEPWLTNWHGNIQIGMDLVFGTTDRQTFYANATLDHVYNRMRNHLTLRSAYGITETPVSPSTPNGSVETANSLEGLVKTDFDLGKRRKIYLYHQAGGGFDAIRRYDVRIEEGAGVGYKLVEGRRWTVNAEVGAQFQHFAYRNGPTLLPYLPDHDTVSARFGENIVWKITEKFRVTERLQFTPNVEDVGDFRARFELGISYPLLKRVTLNLNLFDEYESRPAAFVENNQLQVQSTVGVTF